MAATTLTGDKATCARSLALMATGTVEEMAEVYRADATNREAKDEPEATRGTGPEATHATALWLREAYSDLHWEVHDAVQEGELVVLHTTMSGRQTGPFTVYDEDAAVKVVFPPRGRSFAVTQTHWFRMREGLIAEHWANRDDQGQGEQLGWTPPSPVYLVQMLLARRRARATEAAAPHR
ncbi:ester cyclase [Actinomycetospora sp. OC33-EN08]|uniref:Ester cyclase n=1 Tax=Actinomycetospora aurantiaca TaxID=3129233 RepID=A0ABU8MXS5_9PSEU